MNTICLVLDRLHGGYVGAYGNSWIDTPTLDRLAFESFVFDQFHINSPRLDDLYRSYWQGLHPLLPGDAAAEPALAERLRRAGVQPVLLTDEPAVADHPLARGFEPLVFIERPDQVEVAREVEETQLARCFVELVDWLSKPQEPFFLWAHLAGLGGPWDAPLEFRRQYAAEDDPEPPSTAGVPHLLLERDFDPDLILGFSQTYAGQVSLLDTCLAALWELFESGPLGENTLLVLMSARGFPLGEHRRVGPDDTALYNELVHVPLMMRFPDRLGAGARSGALVEPGDVWATLGQWWNLPEGRPGPTAQSLLPLIRGDVDELRDRLCLVDGQGVRAIRVPAWYLRDAEPPELFVKPDDRWEVNDVADRCANLVEPLQVVLDEYEQAIRTGSSEQLSPLDEIFIAGPE